MERLTPNEYRNAVYLDFEGEGKKRNGFIPQPHMAGIFEPNEKGKGGKYNSFFFLKEWMPVANHLKRSSRLVGFSEYFEVLVDQLIVSKNHLVCWSIHEPMILEMYLPKSTFTKLLPTIHNLHPVAKKYARRRNLFGPDTRTYGKTLDHFYTGFYPARPQNQALPMGAAEACRRVDLACSKTQSWSDFSSKQKGYVRDLIEYNNNDCLMTWLIALKIGNSKW